MQDKVPRLDKRIILVVFCRVIWHPGDIRSHPGIPDGILQVKRVPGGPVELRSTPLHVIRPGLFRVPVRGSVGISLLESFIFLSHPVKRLCSPQAFVRIHGIVKCISPDQGCPGHGRGRPSRQVGHPGGLALEFPQALGLPCGNIGHPVTVLPPPVIRRILIRHLPSHMVAVVRHLVDKQPGPGMQLMDPVQSPPGLIQHIGDPVGKRLSQRIDPVCEPVRVEPVGQQHMGRGIAAGDQVLELVARIMPAPAHIHKGGTGQGSVGGPSIPLVAYHIQVGIVPAALLPHKAQQRFLMSIVSSGRDPETVRSHFRSFSLQVVGPFRADFSEIHFIVKFKPSPPLSFDPAGPDRGDRLPLICRNQENPAPDRRMGEHDGCLGLFWMVTQLVDPEVDLTALIHHNGKRKHKQEDLYHEYVHRSGICGLY